jgi:hypothetical protein
MGNLGEKDIARNYHQVRQNGNCFHQLFLRKTVRNKFGIWFMGKSVEPVLWLISHLHFLPLFMGQQLDRHISINFVIPIPMFRIEAKLYNSARGFNY